MATGLFAAYSESLFNPDLGSPIDLVDGGIDAGFYLASTPPSAGNLDDDTIVDIGDLNTAVTGATPLATHNEDLASKVVGTPPHGFDAANTLFDDPPASSAAVDVLLVDALAGADIITTHELVCYFDLAAAPTPDGTNNIDVQWNAGGIIILG